MANYWMHNGFLQVEGEKMAKSVGNFVTIRELLKDWPGEVLRLNMLRTHYRQPMDWTLRGLEESSKILTEWITLAVSMEVGRPIPEALPPRPQYPPILDALCDDLNTPKAITEIHALRNAIVHDLGHTAVVGLSDALRFLGLLRDEVTDVLDRLKPRTLVDEAKVADLIEARTAARKAKDFAEADRIRDALAAMGIEVEDHKDGSATWKVKR
jgi:cysteinyl-tRNA synthetase